MIAPSIGDSEYQPFEDRLPASRRMIKGLCHPSLIAHLERIKTLADGDWKDGRVRVLSERPNRIAVADLSGRGIGFPPVLVKEFGRRSWIHQLLSPLGRSRPMAALSIGLKLHSCGVLTPTPLLAYEVAHGRLDRVAVIVTSLINDAIKARNILNDSTAEPSGVQTLLEAMATAVRRTHDAGIMHRDLSLGNFLIRKDVPDQVYLIDLSRALHFQRLPVILRLYDLARLNLADRWPDFYDSYCRGTASLIKHRTLLLNLVRIRRAFRGLRNVRMEQSTR
jgi:tRNA A-37 threonylcarbamoyl transferase component Bud32